MARVIFGIAKKRVRSFSGQIRNAMAERKIPQRELAAYLNITQSALSRKLIGRSPWTLAEAYQLEEYFGEEFL